jgi:glutathione S-transferase
MRKLYHFPIDPASRQARIALAEKKLKVKLEQIDPWQTNNEFMNITPEGVPPTLVDLVPGGTITICGARAICEYVNEGSSRHPLLPEERSARAESRRIAAWFDIKFSQEVNAYIVHEKIEKSFSNLGPTDTQTLRDGREHLDYHLSYLTWVLEQRDWLAGDTFSLADIAGVAHISCLDFLSEINWKNWPEVKRWYQTAKSRPSVQGLLTDRLPGFRAPRHYTDLDF